MKIKFIERLTALCVLSLSPQVLSQVNIWLEAETGAEYSPIVVKSDPAASQKIYLAPWKWGDYSERNADNGVILFNVDVPESGIYTLWGRFKLPSGQISPYDIATGDVDTNQDDEWQAWAQASISDGESDTWLWRPSGLSLALSQGEQTIKLVQTAAGPNLKFDKLLLTNDFSYTPEDLGENEASISRPSQYVANTVAKNGQLRIEGTQLSNQNGDEIQLQGISTHGLQWFPLIKQQTIPRTAQFFGSEVLRLAMYIEDYAPSDPSDYWGGYIADPEGLKSATKSAIEDAIAAGVYVIVDWHIHNIPSYFISEAELFFEEIARDYGHYPNIIYEIANEPLNTADWDTEIRPYAIRVIEAIRNNDPDGVVIVGTPTWSQDVDIAARNPLPFNNIMYAFHFYAGTHDINTMRNKVETALDMGAPIFVSEWGSSDVGTSYSNFGVAEQWVDFMNQHRLSWVNWSLGNKDENSSLLKPTANMAGPWTDEDLTEAGLWLKPEFDAPDGSESGENTAPNAADLNISVNAGESVEFVLQGSDSDGYIENYTIETEPNYGDLSISNNNVIYSPLSGYTGDDGFTYSATDNQGASSTIATVSISVISTDTPTTIPTPTPIPTTPTPFPTTPTPTPPAGNDVDCSVSVDSWSNGYVAYTTVVNNTDNEIENWQITLNIGANDDITNSWSVSLSRNGSQIIARGLNYNSSLAAGESIRFGFQASFNEGEFQGVSCVN